MKKLALCLILLACNPARAACDIPQEFWDWPRSADSVLGLKEIRPCMASYLANSKSKLLIHHGKDEESVLRYDELRAWLISLSVSPSRMAEAYADQKGLSIETINR